MHYNLIESCHITGKNYLFIYLVMCLFGCACSLIDVSFQERLKMKQLLIILFD